MGAPKRINQEWIYTCDTCRREGRWSSEWSWFGNFLDYEDGRWERIHFACSASCRVRSRAQIKSITRGLAKCGPSDMMQKLKDARGFQEDYDVQLQVTQRLSKVIDKARRLVHCHVHVKHSNTKKPDDQAILKELLEILGKQGF